MSGPTLKLVKCHRGADALRIAAGIGAISANYKMISSGSLKGCWRRIVGENQRSVYRVHKHWVLEFVICIRVGL